ncbi:helix-turn-helix domain-containing protein [Amycolatopsis sp. H20-H5]|uniref:helix-turn-helix domain-containing protein n=1 Tax=Amycolatopsis sp. H20-H5 TaxID=3046309 RepID=UPI002DB9B747|nr:helix-turn-helix transcriptional regulator [Amycolatopsis sp. H20-H5]MEC3974774.1 helix-turn-helix transcriptional regulator [Amycolatopsis sp. H20-H5]
MGEVKVSVPARASMSGVAPMVIELVALRRALGLSQADIGKAAGLPTSSVSRLEANDYFSTALVRHLAAYAEALGYTLRFVLISHDS